MRSETEAREILTRVCDNAPWVVTEPGASTWGVISSSQIEFLYALMRSGRTFDEACKGVSLTGHRKKDRAAQLLRKAGLIEFRYPREDDPKTEIRHRSVSVSFGGEAFAANGGDTSPTVITCVSMDCVSGGHAGGGGPSRASGGGGSSPGPAFACASVAGVPVSGSGGGGSSPGPSLIRASVAGVQAPAANNTRTKPRGKKAWFVV